MTQSPPAGARATPPSPGARRLAAPRWLDGRLVVGVLLVLAAVVVGSRVFAAAGRYTRVYLAAHALVPGERIEAGDLRVGNVRFDGQGGSYVAAAGTAPTGYVVTRYVGAGELVPRNALTGAATAVASRRLVTVPVEPGHLPDGLGPGDLVDVYLTPKVGSGQPVPAPSRVLTAVPVDSAGSASGGLGGTTAVSVVLAVPGASVPDTVHAVESGTIDLVRLPPAAAAGQGLP